MAKINGNGNSKNGFQTVGQAAKEIGVSRQAVNQMIHDGRIHAIWMLEQWAIPSAEIKRAKARRGKSNQQAA
jgi:excisionase family DNA binding protein